jgi:uncharacterized protein YndB with AHSA1/START domain
MTSNATGSKRVLGSVHTADGKGVVRMEDRFDTDLHDLWSALTQPSRLARWLGEVEGDLRLGGEFRAHFFASGWEGTGRVDACDAPQRLMVTTTSADEGGEIHTIQASLTAEGDQTVLLIEERGMPVDHLAGYGAGIQIHVEDLAAYLAGRDRVPESRWQELMPLYQRLAGQIG